MYSRMKGMQTQADVILGAEREERRLRDNSRVIRQNRPWERPNGDVPAQRGQGALNSPTAAPEKGQNIAYGDGHNIEFGPLEVQGIVEFIPPEIERLPTVQSYNPDLSNLSIPGQWVPGVSRGQVTPGDLTFSNLRNSGVYVVNKTADTFGNILTRPVGIGAAQLVIGGVSTFGGVVTAEAGGFPAIIFGVPMMGAGVTNIMGGMIYGPDFQGVQFLPPGKLDADKGIIRAMLLEDG